MTKYKPLTRFLIVIGAVVVSWTICGVVIYKAVRFAVRVWGAGI